jgi:hypothetical protein
MLPFFIPVISHFISFSPDPLTKSLTVDHDLPSCPHIGTLGESWISSKMVATGLAFPETHMTTALGGRREEIQVLAFGKPVTLGGT